MDWFDHMREIFERHNGPAPAAPPPRRPLFGASFRHDYTDIAGVAAEAKAVAQQEGWQTYSAPVDQGSIVLSGDPAADAAQAAKLGIQLYSSEAMNPNTHEFYFRQLS